MRRPWPTSCRSGRFRRRARDVPCCHGASAAPASLCCCPPLRRRDGRRRRCDRRHPCCVTDRGRGRGACASWRGREVSLRLGLRMRVLVSAQTSKSRWCAQSVSRDTAPSVAGPGPCVASGGGTFAPPSPDLGSPGRRSPAPAAGASQRVWRDRGRSPVSSSQRARLGSDARRTAPGRGPGTPGPPRCSGQGFTLLVGL